MVFEISKSVRNAVAETIREFGRDVQGNVAMMVGVGALTLMTGVGAAIDYSLMSARQSDLQAALDAGVLAAAASSSQTDWLRKADGERVVRENLSGTGLDAAEFELAIDNNGVVTGSGTFAYQPFLMHIVGIEEMDVSAFAQAGTEASIIPAEIVFVLDYSSSMNDHYEAMRDAAIELIEGLTAGTDADLRFGIVPFAEEVYFTVDGRYIAGGTSGHGWSGCTVSRKWPFVVSDRTPNASQRSRWGLNGSDCDEYTDRNLVVTPLATDKEAVIAQLNAMVPHHGTNTSLGVEIGYQLLSPNLPFEASPYSDGKPKFMIVLSDGELTRGSFGPGDRFTEDQATQNLQSVCNAAARAGISVVTVLYETSDTAARTAMQGCASQPSLFMEADAGSVSERFSLIADLVKSDIRLTR